MHYNGPIVRPQTDANSIFLEVTVGCTHNSCTFCNFYHGYPFRMAPLSQIEADLKEVAAVRPKARQVWASGGNPYALPTDRLARVGRLIRQYLPRAEISTYARVDDLTRKSAEEMRHLKELGWGDLVVGFETGDDEVLAHVNKGYTAKDILEGCRRLEEAGVAYRMIQLGGLAGRGRCVDSAIKTARLLNQLHPYRMYLNSVSILPDTELYEEREAGLFVEASQRERIEEFIALLEHMEHEIEVFAAPNTTPFSFFVDLQPCKEELLRQMRLLADSITEEDELRCQVQRSARRSV